ncbi:MAG TPA: lipid A deacylase LpxR family protein [Burkholderiales bacterium]
MYFRPSRSRFLALLALIVALGAAAQPEQEPYDSGWAFYADNDLLAPGHSDRDYTGGFSLTIAGRRAREAWWSIDALRAGSDHLLRLDSLYAERKLTRHSAEVGVTVFTPGNLTDPAQQVGDRPYASLIYLSNTGVQVTPERDLAYLSTFTLGVLGAPFVGNGQKALHRALGGEEPVGWEHQISDGGEPTFRYSFARVQRAWAGKLAGTNSELTTTWRASVGYLTEATFGVAARSGKFTTPWWSYNPQIAEYAEKSVPVVASEGGGAEHYFWGGFNLKARLYNAFLQGQFRHSDVTFSASELNPLLVEGWLGYTFATAGGWRFSYVLRAQSPEVRNGPADRTQTWGGIIVSYAR